MCRGDNGVKKILFVNGCVRPQSRTLELAHAVLEKLEGQLEEIRLFEDGPSHLTWDDLRQRDQLVAARAFDHPMLRWARQFAEADEIVVAAPYWDLMFPAVVRSYFEAVTVTGLTFKYGPKGEPQGLCRAGRLTYVTTAGGPIIQNFGFDYVTALAQTFYGIGETKCVKAEGLDIWGADTAELLKEAKRMI